MKNLQAGIGFQTQQKRKKFKQKIIAQKIYKSEFSIAKSKVEDIRKQYEERHKYWDIQRVM